MGRNFRDAIRLLKFNWAVTWRFQMLFLLAGSLVLAGICEALLRATLALEGVGYLSAETLGAVATHPATWVFIVVVVLLAALICLFEASALIFIFDASRQQRKTGMRAAFAFAWGNSKRLFADRGRNLSMIPVMLVLMPALGMGALGSFFGGLQIPEFIMEAITQNTLYIAALVVVAIVVVIFLLRWCLALHFFTLEGLTGREAHRASARLGVGTHLRVVGSVLAVYLVFLALAIIIVLVALGVLAVAYLALDLTTVPGALALGFGLVCAIAVVLVCATVLVAVSTIALGNAYYRYKDRADERIPDLPVPEHRPLRAAGAVTWGIAACLAVAGIGASGGLIYYTATEGVPEVLDELVQDSAVEITAHRGGSHSAPENTMAAFRTAASQGADWVELDVQMSSDGELFIMHDTSFSRTCGVDANTWELSWAEIQKLDASNGWTQYAGEHVPSFDEVLAWAKESGMRLNVEIKPTGNEPSSLEQAVVDKINAYGLADRCWVASLNYDVLEKVKAADASMPTLLNMAIAYGDIASMSAADNFSIEASNLSTELVEDVHAAGKKLAVWTVNDTDNMTTVLLEDIDNIVTDEVVEAQSKRALLSKAGIAGILKQVTDFKQSLSSGTE